MPSKELEEFSGHLLDGLEFRRRVYSKLSKINSLETNHHTQPDRPRFVKKIYEELIPICRYIEIFYGPGKIISVMWLDGGQPYDAELNTKGLLVENGKWPANEKLEVTQAIHRNEHKSREVLKKWGYHYDMENLDKYKCGNSKENNDFTPEFTYYDLGEHPSDIQRNIQQISEMIVKSIEAKNTKHDKGRYSENTNLVVNLTPPILINSNEWNQIIILAKNKIESQKRRFMKILLICDGPFFAAII